MQENPEYLQWWRLHSLCWKCFLVFGHLYCKPTPHPSTPLPAALFKSVSSILVRTFNNIVPSIYLWGILLVTIQTSYCRSRDPEPGDAASFLSLSPFYFSNSYLTNLALRTSWETVKHLTWVKVSSTSPAVHKARQQSVWSGNICLHHLTACLPLTFSFCAISPSPGHSKWPLSQLWPAWRDWCQEIPVISWTTLHPGFFLFPADTGVVGISYEF